MNMSDWLNSINYTKQDLILDNPILEREYVPFIINRSLSYFPDTLFHCNEMNFKHFLTKKMQYDYLRLSVSKRKRFSKWFKEEKNDNIKLIQEYYGYSYRRAKEVLDCLIDDNIRTIKDSLKTGGVKS